MVIFLLALHPYQQL